MDSDSNKDKYVGGGEHFEHSGDRSPSPVHISDAALNPTEEVAYGPTGVRGLISSPYIFGAAMLASMGGFSFGYDQGVISIINTMDVFHKTFPQSESAFGKGFMTGMLEFGAMLGCFFMPTLCDKVSRKMALTIVVVIFNIGAIMQTAANSYGVLVAGRTIAGIGVGTLAMGAPIYISEIAPPNLRGTLLVLESISIVGGVVISFWITYGTRHLPGEEAFRLPFGLQMVSATILGMGIHFFPFSPRWLALVGRSDDALSALCRLRRLPPTDERICAEHRGILTEVAIQQKIQAKHHPNVKPGSLKAEFLGWTDLLKKKMWRRTIVGVGVAVFQQFSGINAFIYYAPTLFESLGQDSEMALIMSGIFNILQWVAVITCFFIVDKVGRKPLAVFGGFAAGTAWMIMAILVGKYSSNWPAHADAGWAAVAMAFIFVLTFGVSYSCLGWMLPAEVFTNATRAKGVALSTATNWLCNFIVGVATPPMIENLGFGTYIFFGSFCLIAGFWALFLVPETKGKTLEQMDDLFKDTAAQEEKEVLRNEILAEAHAHRNMEQQNKQLEA